MSDATERWCELADAEAAGESLGAEEQAFLREHALDAEHASEHALFADIERLGEPGPVLAADRERAAATLMQFRAMPPAEPRARWGRAAIALVVAAAAIVLLWIVVEPRLADRFESGPASLAEDQAVPEGETVAVPSPEPQRVAPKPAAPPAEPEPSVIVDEPVVTPPVRKPAPREDRSKTASQMLAEARALANAGALARAVAAYDALRRAHPDSADANAANVSIGELQLRRGRAREALRAFERYLERGGALAEEARWGRVRALDALGRTDARNRAIDQFLAAHPHTVYAREAKAMKQSG